MRWNEPVFGKEEINSVKEVLEEGFVSEGPKSKDLVEKLKDYLGVKHVILTTSGTAALFIAVKADQIIRNLKDFEVIVPDLTFISSAYSAANAGGEIKIADIRKDNFCVDVDEVKKKITDNTKIIMPVHVIGRGCDMKELNELAQEKGITIIEDAANALGSMQNGKMLGTFGKMGCFSLQANKIINCGQGGFVVTDDDEYAEVLNRLKDFGRFNKEEIPPIIGHNFKFNDILSSIALEQFKQIDKRIDFFREQRNKYVEGLKDINSIKFPEQSDDEVPLYIDVLVEDRAKLIEFLESKDISARKCWPPIHRHPPYQNLGVMDHFPITSEVSDNCLWLPNGMAISLEDIEKVCKAIKEFFHKN